MNKIQKRGIWKGNERISVISCGIKLKKAGKGFINRALLSFFNVII